LFFIFVHQNDDNSKIQSVSITLTISLLIIFLLIYSRVIFLKDIIYAYICYGFLVVGRRQVRGSRWAYPSKWPGYSSYDCTCY